MRLREGTKTGNEVKHEIDGGDDRSYAYAQEAPSLGLGGRIHCRRIVARHVERVDGAGLDDGHNAERQAAEKVVMMASARLLSGLGIMGLGPPALLPRGADCISGCV